MKERKAEPKEEEPSNKNLEEKGNRKQWGARRFRYFPILPGLFPAHGWTAVLTSSRFDVNARIVVYRCRCLFVCLYVYCSPIQRHFQKQRGGKKIKKHPEEETPHKRKTNRGNCKLQKGKQKHKNSSSIMRATEFHPSQKQTIHGKALLLGRKG